jgi:MFS family permease
VDTAAAASRPRRWTRGLRAVGRGAAGAGRSGFHRWRVAARSAGAGESGLTGLTDLSLLNSAGDTLVAVALASTLFFAVPTTAARGRVGLYLLTTVAPFALIAPVIGPLLDRFSHGRRTALCIGLVARAVLAWELAAHHGGLTLYPLALGSLVASKAFGVARSSVVPRVLPPGASLVRTNSRLQLASTLTSLAVAPLAAGVSYLFGYHWLLRLDVPVYLVGAVVALRLPALVDSTAGEVRATGLGSAVMTGERFTDRIARPRTGRRFGLGGLPAALRGMMPLRALVGFLTLFLAFLLRSHHGGTLGLAALAASAGVGSGLGLLVGRALSARAPESLVAGGLCTAAVSCLAAAVVYSKPLGLLVALLATLSWTAGKLGLDAIIQRDIPEHVRTSAFGRSETALQLAWVAGGALGLAPLSGREGFVLAAGGMLAALLLELGAHRLGAPRTAGLTAGGPAPPGRPAPPG